jgi:hypothetical protein
MHPPDVARSAPGYDSDAGASVWWLSTSPRVTDGSVRCPASRRVGPAIGNKRGVLDFDEAITFNWCRQRGA